MNQSPVAAFVPSQPEPASAHLMQTTAPLDRFAPAPWWQTLWSVTLHVLVFTALAIIFARVAPRFEQVFRDFEIKLPAVSECTLALGHVVQNYLIFFICAFMLIELPITVAVQYLPHGFRALRYIWNYGILLGGLALVVISLLTLTMPLLSLVENMSK